MLSPGDLAAIDQRAAQAAEILDIALEGARPYITKHQGARGLITLAITVNEYFEMLDPQLGDPHLTMCEVLAEAIRRLAQQ